MTQYLSKKVLKMLSRMTLLVSLKLLNNQPNLALG
jgi:hypothetical protein